MHLRVQQKPFQQVKGPDMDIAVKLPFSFDAQRMLQELEALESDRVWLSHPDYTVAKSGDWTAIAMVSTDGDHTGPDSLRYNGEATATPTALLLKSPYLLSVFEKFKTRVHRVRLMNLKPGTKIAEHRDYGAQRYSYERGFIRVHIPIRTHERVAWRLRGEKVNMQPGEAWYINVCEPHSVENLSDVNRVHMVLDMEVNDWVRDQFPPASIVDRFNGVVLRNFESSFLKAKRRTLAVGAAVKQKLGDLGLRNLKKRLVN
jgi:mannose-6-phosphate isomerase-like protein (cupin superfamily)